MNEKMKEILEQYEKNKVNDRTGDERHKLSIWASDFIPSWQEAATLKEIQSAEERIGFKFPNALVEELLIQKGGHFVCFNTEPIEEEYESMGRTYSGVLGGADIDGINQLENWELASKNHWFDSVVDEIEGLNKLVKIAGHSECQLCIDYRGDKFQNPGLVYFSLGVETKESVVCDNLIEFINALRKFKREVVLPRFDEILEG